MMRHGAVDHLCRHILVVVGRRLDRLRKVWNEADALDGVPTRSLALVRERLLMTAKVCG